MMRVFSLHQEIIHHSHPLKGHLSRKKYSSNEIWKQEVRATTVSQHFKCLANGQLSLDWTDEFDYLRGPYVVY